VQEETSSILYQRTKSVYMVESLPNMSDVTNCHALQVCVVEHWVSGWSVCALACVRAWCPSLGRRFASESLPDVRLCLCTMYMK